ncbi:MAG: hypothetical protein ACKVZ0_22035 [Gemmatimonadales bacterium]
MTEHDDPLGGMIARLKEPAELSPDFTDRVMAAIAIAPRPELAPARPTRWWRRRWTLQVSPFGALATAAGLVGLVFASQRYGRAVGGVAPTVPAVALAADAGTESRGTQFVLVAPAAKAVAVVGDFNDWSTTATPLVRSDGDGVWWVTVPLAPGRYRYAFVVDGTVWQQDPEATTLEDEFGRPSSVVTIGGA